MARPPQPRRGWAVVRIRAASVNPSDVKNVEGQMERTVLPHVPGRDFSGASRPEVWGTGFTLDGSHAELIAIPGAALWRKPSRLDQAQAARSALPSRWVGLVYAALRKARTS
jgi:NADPH:quinone reductase